MELILLVIAVVAFGLIAGVVARREAAELDGLTKTNDGEYLS